MSQTDRQALPPKSKDSKTSCGPAKMFHAPGDSFGPFFCFSSVGFLLHPSPFCFVSELFWRDAYGILYSTHCTLSHHSIILSHRGLSAIMTLDICVYQSYVETYGRGFVTAPSPFFADHGVRQLWATQRHPHHAN